MLNLLIVSIPIDRKKIREEIIKENLQVSNIQDLVREEGKEIQNFKESLEIL